MWMDTSEDGIVMRIMAWADKHHLLLIIPLLGVIATIAGSLWLTFMDIGEPEPLTAASEAGTYCYLDVQYLSGWVLKVDGDEYYKYYQAADSDAEKIWYISLSDEAFEELSYLVDFSYSDGSGEVPEPVRVSGMVTKIPEDDLTTLANGMRIDEQTFKESIGPGYLNAKANPRTEGVLLCIIGGTISVVWLALKLGSDFYDSWLDRKEGNHRAKKEKKSKVKKETPPWETT